MVDRTRSISARWPTRSVSSVTRATLDDAIATTLEGELEVLSRPPLPSQQ